MARSSVDRDQDTYEQPLILRGMGLINHVVGVPPLSGSIRHPGPRCGLGYGLSARATVVLRSAGILETRSVWKRGGSNCRVGSNPTLSV